MTGPERVGRLLLAERFPQASAGWLGGSVATGMATSTSDLDITVLLAGPPAPYRESVRYGGWPVELFVHTKVSLAHYRAKDQARRQPTMMRLVGESVVLLDTDGSGVRLQADCRAEVEAGPAPLTDDELSMLRYRISGLIDDLVGAGGSDEGVAVASALWRDAAELLLTGEMRWTGTAKGLLREVATYDRDRNTAYASALMDGLRAATSGNIDPLVRVADEILARYGGRLFDGFHLT